MNIPKDLVKNYTFRCASIFALALALLHIAAQCWLSRSDKDRAREMKIETEEEPALLNHSDMKKEYERGLLKPTKGALI